MTHQIKKLYEIKEHLSSLVEEATSNDLSCVDTHEIGEVIDMIKDLSQAIYYDTIVEAMHDKDVITSDEFDMNQAMTDIRHIWSEADPNYRIALKSNVQRLLNDMND